MTLNERMNAIEKKAEKIKKENENEKMAAEIKIQKATKDILNMADRIVAVITLANKCLDCGIMLPDCYTTVKYGYGDGSRSFDFCADGIYHHVGFMDCKRGCWQKGEIPFNKIEYLGVVNGGYNGPYDFYTNGKEVFSKDNTSIGTISEAKLEHMEKFLYEFEVFEDAFYKWLDDWC